MPVELLVDPRRRRLRSRWDSGGRATSAPPRGQPNAQRRASERAAAWFADSLLALGVHRRRCDVRHVLVRGPGRVAVPGRGIGLLAARSVNLRAALLATGAAGAGIALAVVLGSPWPLVAGLLTALALALVRERRDVLALVGALLVAGAALLALRSADIVLAVALAPALLVLAALAAGRPQREAAGAVTGFGWRSSRSARRFPASR